MNRGAKTAAASGSAARLRTEAARTTPGTASRCALAPARRPSSPLTPSAATPGLTCRYQEPAAGTHAPSSRNSPVGRDRRSGAAVDRVGLGTKIPGARAWKRVFRLPHVTGTTERPAPARRPRPHARASVPPPLRARAPGSPAPPWDPSAHPGWPAAIHMGASHASDQRGPRGHCACVADRTFHEAGR